jgi:nicotinamide phosphoribosyltransferase
MKILNLTDLDKSDIKYQMGTKESEIATFKRLLDLYPTGILSVVSDTWDLWKVLTEYLPAIKEEVLARDGKLVIRPDSGDPVDIICGYVKGIDSKGYPHLNKGPEFKGVIELLWDVFGGTVNAQGYKVLDPHIGAIYGDSITLNRAKEICERLKAKGFASTNIVLGIGSYTYQYNTRDTFGFAMKATYGEITTQEVVDTAMGMKPELFDVIEPREIFKDPITDDGTKKSKKGLLKVCYDGSMETYKSLGKPADGTIKPIICKDQQTWQQESEGLLTTIFKDGQLVKQTTLTEIRNRLCQ